MVDVVERVAPAGAMRAELAAWSQHWSDDNQERFWQRFFSFYRKAVFARTVRYFVDKYFPPTGTFVEAGSGTSETSMRIDKCGGGRKLIAVDIVHGVLRRGHPHMDVRVCGDVFQLPFRTDSIAGVWNVGVMEHFPWDQIDCMLREFHRVLEPGARLVLLWPGSDSIPQRMLGVVERIVNHRKDRPPFHFHPDEISRLKSSRQARAALERNGFQVLEIEPGPRSLMAFKVLVGAKR